MANKRFYFVETPVGAYVGHTLAPSGDRGFVLHDARNYGGAREEALSGVVPASLGRFTIPALHLMRVDLFFEIPAGCLEAARPCPTCGAKKRPTLG